MGAYYPNSAVFWEGGGGGGGGGGGRSQTAPPLMKLIMWNGRDWAYGY